MSVRGLIREQSSTGFSSTLVGDWMGNEAARTQGCIHKGMSALEAVVQPAVHLHITGTYRSVFIQMQYCLNYFTFIVDLEFRYCNTSSFVLLFKIVLSIGGYFYTSYMNFRIFFASFNSVKNVIGMLIKIA